MLLNVIEDDYAFYVHPETYINISDFTQNEKDVLNQVKDVVLEKTKGSFAKWSLGQRAKWLSKYSVVVEEKRMTVIPRKRQGDWHHIFKDMMSAKHKMRLEMRKRSR